MRALSGELDYRIRYDVEHNLFYAKNVFNDEYIKPTFIEYVQKLEKENEELNEQVARMINGACNIYQNDNDRLRLENAELKKKIENLQKYLDTRNCYRECAETWLKLTEAKEIIKELLDSYKYVIRFREYADKKPIEKAEQFLKESE